MAIWLKRAYSATGGSIAQDLGARVGAECDVVRRETFGELVSLDEANAALAAEREAVLATACDEAARIVASGHVEASRILDAAQREYAAANELGYRDGCDRAIADWMQRLANAADAQNKLQTSMRERLASIVASAVEQIVRAEPHEVLFERALATVDRIVDSATYLRVSVHPEEHEAASAVFERLAASWRDLGQPIPLSVVGDKRLAPGSCVCETDFGTVDVSLETQLRAMRNAVSRALKHSVEDAVNDVEHSISAESTASEDEDADKGDRDENEEKAGDAA